MIRVAAPSNIALIKYMGKEDGALNLPANGSLSMTLSSLRTEIDLRPAEDSGAPDFRWHAELPEGLEASRARVPDLSASGVERYLRHARRVVARTGDLLAENGIEPAKGSRGWEIRTANTFPSDSGIASSASSFAALTLAVFLSRAADPRVAHSRAKSDVSLRRSLARLSREGSGSSCRSFEGPWVEWSGENAAPVPSSMPPLADLILLVSSGKKPVSSSQAHAQVTTSPLWAGRAARAEARLIRLKSALATADRSAVSALSWEELWEMHSLFHTASTPFTYWEPETVRALKTLAPWVTERNPPIVTMDAGANVHVLVPASERSEWERRLADALPGLAVLGDEQGPGALGG